MTILTMNRRELEKRIGKVTSSVEDLITMMGTPVEDVTADEVSVEVFPNRPDLLSLENFSRAFNQFNKKAKVASFKVASSKEVVTVKKSLPSQWPFAVACIVKGLKFDDEKIKSLIDVQEKLHGSILRKRKKGGLGVYPLDKVSFPITFEGRAPQDIVFRPLESDTDLSARQILKSHPTGVAYGHVCDGWDTLPVFVDANKQILSMPPIINSHDTGRITEDTTDIFVEATGNNLHAITKAFNILVSSLYEMGGKVYSVTCVQRDGTKLTIPDFSFEKMDFEISDLEKTLGISLSKKQVSQYLSRMGIGCEFKKKKGVALIPAYRNDMLHWVDLAEEVAIAHGYDNFVPEIPRIATIGQEDAFEKQKHRITEILVGLGLLEVSSYHIAAKKNIKKMHFDYKDFVELEDSKTDRDVLRIDLLSNLLAIFSENSDSGYPQKVFEVGTVFEKDAEQKSETGILEREHLGVAIVDDEVGFTDLKQILDYLFKMLDKTYSIEEVDDANYITGRVGAIKISKQTIGKIGEIAPRVLKNWKIKAPVVALELDVKKLVE